MKLVYYKFCPFSIALRIAIIEKNIPFSLDVLNPWESMEDKIIVSPTSTIPMIYDEIAGKKFTVMSAFSCYEYLNEAYKDVPLFGKNIVIRSEIRRLISWMDNDFFRNISSKFINEKIIKRIKNTEFPDSSLIIEAFEDMSYYMDYIEYLISRRRWIAGNDFSMADIVVGAHLSLIDYLGDINWEKYPNIKEWYVKLKSRPSFQEILEDKIGSIVPSSNYKNLDF